MPTDSGPPLTLLDFEKPIVDLQVRVERLRAAMAQAPELAGDVERLEAQVEHLQRETFANLTRWQVVQLARHARRPTTLDYIDALVPDFMELHGDRVSGDDVALVGGVGTFAGRSCLIIAHARGRSNEDGALRNFGMTRPSGFRKAVRLAKTADRLGLPVVNLIDTPGAHPGADAEEHGQAFAIAECIETFASVSVPVVACVVGEGGSGGAIALAVADWLLMQEYTVFPVISPEACSSILYRDGLHAEQMADALKPTARDLKAAGLADEIVPEPQGGAHRNPVLAAQLLGRSIAAALDRIAAIPEADRLEHRYRRIRSYGVSTPALIHSR